MKAWFDRVERRLSWLALPELSTFIVGMNAAVWVLTLLKPEFPRVLLLDPDLVLSGQVWRVFTFLFIPPAMEPLWMFFWLYLLFVYARALEERWGDVRFNLFYGIGAAATVCASLMVGQGLSNLPLNTSIFLAFAALYPDFELLLLFILPVKIKWLAVFAWLGIAWTLLTGGWAERVGLGAGLSNYAVFFLPQHLSDLRQRLEQRRRRRMYKDAFK